MEPLSSDEEELDADAELVALRLAAGQSHAEAALAIGRTAKWVQRRSAQDPMFAARVRHLKAERVEQASAGLGALLEAAVAAVARNLAAERPSDQLHAARLVFDRSRLFRKDAEMMERIELLESHITELEARVDDMTGGQGTVR